MPTEEMMSMYTFTDEGWTGTASKPSFFDEINETQWSDYKYLNDFEKTSDGLLKMTLPIFETATYANLSGLAYNVSTLHFPVLAQDVTHQPVWSEIVTYDSERGAIDSPNVELRYAENINAYFLLTSDRLQGIYDSTSNNALGYLTSEAGRLIKSLSPNGWGVSIPTSLYLEALMSLMAQDIAPPIDGRELHNKIKEKTLNIDNFISTSFRTAPIGKISTSVVRSKKLGAYSGAGGGSIFDMDSDEAGSGPWFEAGPPTADGEEEFDADAFREEGAVTESETPGGAPLGMPTSPITPPGSY
jgi:hypothetical protein|tara:strand:+ start:11064 stop:11966 length:903 start_codon:yes stop_codon:yes gene_type:complete